VDGGLLEFDFIEPMGTFHGGLIVAGFDRINNLQDTHGTALAIYPLVVPEPGGVGLFGLAVLSSLVFRMRFEPGLR
jgi:hypothetical protein